MSDNTRHIEVPAKRFLTNHEVFDDIVHLNHGYSILMLDETFSEAYKLLHLLFQNYGRKNIGKHYEILANSTMASVSHPDDEVINVGEKGLSDISIDVNQLRQKFPSSPIIHMGLPEMLMQNTHDDILRLLTSWQKNIRQNNTIEFYILPRGTFKEFERKILSIVDGGLEIRIDHSEGRFKSFLKPIRNCSPENHLKEFQYKINEGRLLIKYGDNFSDKLISFDENEINLRIEDYKKNLRFLKVISGEKSNTHVSVYDYWLFSQIQGHLLSELQEIFPEEFDSLLRKIASWQIADIVRVTQSTDKPSTSNKKNTRLSWKTKFALSIPTSISSKLISYRTGKPRSIPLDFAVHQRKATLAFIDMLFSQLDIKETDYMERLLEMQKRFNDIGTRETAIKHTSSLNENIAIALDIQYFPKLLELTFYNSYKQKPTLFKKSEKEFIFTIPDCYVCSGIEYAKPVCSTIEGTIEGLCGSIFKRKANCNEIECKAVGDESCVFRIEIK